MVGPSFYGRSLVFRRPSPANPVQPPQPANPVQPTQSSQPCPAQPSPANPVQPTQSSHSSPASPAQATHPHRPTTSSRAIQWLRDQALCRNPDFRIQRDQPKCAEPDEIGRGVMVRAQRLIVNQRKLMLRALCLINRADRPGRSVGRAHTVPDQRTPAGCACRIDQSSRRGSSAGRALGSPANRSPRGERSLA
jgi:hypothetical protein